MQSNDEFTAASFTGASFRAATVREPVSAAGSRMQSNDEFRAASFTGASFESRDLRSSPPLIMRVQSREFQSRDLKGADTGTSPTGHPSWIAAPSARAQDPLIEAGFEHFYNIEYAESIAIFQQAIRPLPRTPPATTTWPRPCCSA